MSEPEKNIKPTSDVIKDATEANETHDTPAPAAANGNEPVAKAPVINDNKAPVEKPAAVVTPTVVSPAVVSNEKPAEIPAAAPTPAAPAADAKAPVAKVPAAEVKTPEAAAVTPAPEAAAPVVAAPAAEAPAATADAPAAPKASRKHKILSFAFNMAAGAAVTAVAKMAVVSMMTWAAAPAVATLLVSSLAVGAASTAFCHLGKTRAAKKQGLQGPKFWTKQNAKVFAKSSTFALIGGALFLGFHEGIIQNAWNHIMGHAPAAVPAVVPAVVVAPPVEHVVAPVAPPVEHVVAAPPVAVAPPPVVPCVTPVEQFNTLVSGHHVSPQVTEALHRAASHNAHVAAQGTKDLAFYAQNGIGGVPKDAHVAVELFKQAADSGNVQARVDMLYLQHYGLDTVAQNKAASLSAMKDIAHNARAGEFVKAWGGAGKTLPHVDFDTNTILKGVKLACPSA